MLLNESPERIQETLGSMKRDCDKLEREIASIVYYMNGGLSFSDAHNLSMQQLELLADVISTHYEKQNEAFKQSKTR
jgi:hypothetical protein